MELKLIKTATGVNQKTGGYNCNNMELKRCTMYPII